ncbi:hypothetical protein KCU93_g2639, partial [Aureobasidium melanogenum]
MGQSMLGWKADDFFVAVKQQLDALGPDSLHEACKSFQRLMEAVTQKLSLVDVDLSHQALRAFQRTSNVAAGKLTQLNVNHFQDVLTAVHQMVDNITLATWTIPNAFAMFMCILLFMALMVTLAASMIRIMRNLDKRVQKASASLQTVSSEITSQGVLNHQRLFAEAVYNFIALQHMQQCMHPDEYPVEAKHNEAQYVVFHPSNDWHPSFFAYGTGKWSGDFMDEGNDHILKKVRLFSSPQKLARYLNDYANAQATENPKALPLMYILLPSADTYTLPFTLHIPQQLQHVRVVGQTDRSGKPYCRACITGVKPSDVIDVDLLAEHEAPDYAPRGSTFDKRLYPLLWLVIAILWFKQQLGRLFGLLGDVAWDWCGCLLWPY